ncbi:MAG: hypothetical protein DIZ78_09455 [endosymbiont of Escarpia spicata]|uniref:Uncharacterized protein n=1 Tax=endosymbiont of Escarpia spicata TaxID=2200908 RepID=A0A370DNA4_9GAMM|nr:MAG: hypothetical protein DIZ78_09455 [endosymbiont of Escarpia spicata]
MTTETQAAFARRLGVNRATVTRAKQAGRLVMEGKRVEIEQSLARWHATKAGRTDLDAIHAEQRGATVPTTQIETATDPAGAPADRTQYKAHYENQQIKLEMGLRRGLRFLLADVSRESHGLGATLRAGIERLIDQTAPRLAIIHSDEERAILLQKEILKIKSMMKSEFAIALRRMRSRTEWKT